MTIKLIKAYMIAVLGLIPGFVGAAWAQSVRTPDSISSSGRIVYCTEAGFPPMEFFPADSKEPIGFDIELGNAIAKRLGVRAEFDNMGFDGLIAALLAKKCDAILSAMNATDTRKQQVNFSNYIGDGYALIVKTANPRHVTAYDGVCGLTVGVQVATTNLEEVTRQSDSCVKDGKKPVDIKVFQNDTGLRLALATNQVDAYNQTAATAAYAIIQDPKTFQLGASGPVAANQGIATRKDDGALGSALDDAIKGLYRDGTVKTMLTKWHLEAFALPF